MAGKDKRGIKGLLKTAGETASIPGVKGEKKAMPTLETYRG